MAAGASAAVIGSSVKLRGELSGTEDLEFNGEIKGSISLTEAQLTIGANGKVTGDLSAKNVVVLGKVQGNIRAVERVDLRSSADVAGEIVAARLQVEPGAELHVKVKQTAVEPQAVTSEKAAEEKADETPNLFTTNQGASEADAGTAKPPVAEQSTTGSKKK